MRPGVQVGLSLKKEDNPMEQGPTPTAVKPTRVPWNKGKHAREEARELVLAHHGVPQAVGQRLIAKKLDEICQLLGGQRRFDRCMLAGKLAE